MIKTFLRDLWCRGRLEPIATDAFYYGFVCFMVLDLLTNLLTIYFPSLLFSLNPNLARACAYWAVTY